MKAAWRTATEASDSFLDTLTTGLLETHPVVNGQPMPESLGTLLRRTTYHYWYHIGEIQAVRQLVGHTNLPDFVGDIGEEAPYRRE